MSSPPSAGARSLCGSSRDHDCFSIKEFYRIEREIPSKLILNELIQNAIEHGFKEQEVGHIHVQVCDSDGQVTLIVTNDGLPLPPDFDASKSNTLGLKIIDNLTRGTLRGKFTMVSENGQTTATLRFPHAAG